MQRTSEQFRCKIQVANLLLVITSCICAVDDCNSCSSFHLFSFSFFFFLILQLCEGYLSRRIFLQTSFNDTATLFIVNIYQTRQASALRTEYLILDSIFIIKKTFQMGSLFLKRKWKRKQTKQKNQPMHFSTTEYVSLWLRDNWDFEFNLLFSHLSKWPVAGAWSVKKNVIRI